jgi:hypothetical protein
VIAVVVPVARNPLDTPFEGTDNPILRDVGEAMFPAVEEAR